MLKQFITNLKTTRDKINSGNTAKIYIHLFFDTVFMVLACMAFYSNDLIGMLIGGFMALELLGDLAAYRISENLTPEDDEQTDL